MADEENYAGQNILETNTRLRDLEEKQRILKDRLLLIGENLLEFKEESSSKIIELKKSVETLNNSMERLKSFIETLSGEIPKFARKEDLEILQKQAKMFQPLELVTKKDLERLKKD